MKKKQNLNQFLLDSLPYPAMLIRKDRTILAANRIAREMGVEVGGYCWCDFAKSQFISNQHENYINKHKEIPTTGTHCYFCLADKALNTQAPVNNPNIQAFGKICDMYWVPLNGGIYLHYVIDITERKKAQEELRIKNSAIASCINAIAIADLEGNLIYTNPSFLKLWGYEDEKEVLGKPAIKFWREEEKALKVIEVLRDKLSWIDELIALKKDGSTFNAQLMASRVTDEKHRPICLMGSFIDITKRKKAEEKLKIAHTQLSQILNTAGDGIRVIGKDFNVLQISQTFLTLSGISREEAVSKKCYEMFYGTLCHTPSCPLNRIIDGEKHVEFEVVKKRKDGNKIYCIVTATPFQSLDGELIGIVEHFKNITDRKKAEEEIKQQQMMLKEFSRKILSIREEEKKKLSIDLHDEIGSIALALTSSLVSAEKKIKDNDLRGLLKSIYQSRRTLKKTIETLKKIARDLRPPDLDVIGLPNVLRDYFSNISKQTKIKIDFNEDIGNRELNEGVAIIFYRVAQEALNNIIRHSKARSVKISLYSQENNLKFNICDDGKGFDLAKSLQRTKTLRMGILGMRERVESLSGMFIIESAPKKGTKISITLPNTKVYKS